MLDYRSVCAALNKRGLLGHLIRARLCLLSAPDARIVARAILGDTAIVRVKRTLTSWAYPHNGSITLACNAERRVRLSSILHECAHVLDYRKGKKLGHSGHGEPFVRTYARLLKEMID